ncbi:hypothetical protein [Micromonospora sp. NPDC006431]
MTVGLVVRAFEGDGEVVSCEQPACPLVDGCLVSRGAPPARNASLGS